MLNGLVSHYVEVHLQIDSSVSPVAHPHYNISVALRS